VDGGDCYGSLRPIAASDSAGVKVACSFVCCPLHVHRTPPSYASCALHMRRVLIRVCGSCALANAQVAGTTLPLLCIFNLCIAKQLSAVALPVRSSPQLPQAAGEAWRYDTLTK
jgi:hypothetical protein